jgi:hypothetical protein
MRATRAFVSLSASRWSFMLSLRFAARRSPPRRTKTVCVGAPGPAAQGKTSFIVLTYERETYNGRKSRNT